MTAPTWNGTKCGSFVPTRASHPSAAATPPWVLCESGAWCAGCWRGCAGCWRGCAGCWRGCGVVVLDVGVVVLRGCLDVGAMALDVGVIVLDVGVAWLEQEWFSVCRSMLCICKSSCSFCWSSYVWQDRRQVGHQRREADSSQAKGWLVGGWLLYWLVSCLLISSSTAHLCALRSSLLHWRTSFVCQM